MKYRADIDGLRAIAVLLVVLFHAGVPIITGGYIGVDVFFVISGYLITGILINDIDTGRFSLIRFYERRVRRIFPALFVMILACCVAAYVLMMPRDMLDFGKSVVATAFSASNMIFWWQSGYFDGAAAAKPLLHTWSLAVEEQFYIVFPVLLFCIYHWLRGHARLCIVILGIISFFLCVSCLWISPISGFYLAPMRAWELLVGSLLATGTPRALTSELQRNVISAAGLGSIGVAAVLFDAQTPFPGYAALVPALGTAAVIYAGASGSSLTSRLLQQKPLVGVGLISYSLYLWHWPILVFTEYYNIDRRTPFESAAAVACSFLASYLSWKYVETPFRSKGAISSRWLVFAGGAAAITCSVSFAGAMLLNGGFPQRFSPEVRSVLAASNSVTGRLEACSGKMQLQLRAAGPCAIGASARPTAFIWGDSHADALTGAFQLLSKRDAISFYYGVDASCPPLLGIGTDQKCIDDNDQRFKFLTTHPEIEIVVLAARWTSYIEGRAVDFGPAESNEQLPSLISSSGTHFAKFSTTSKEQFAAAIRNTVQKLLSSGKKVIVVYPIPETGYNIPTTLARKIVKGESPMSFTRPADYYWRRHRFILSVLDDLPYGPRLMSVKPQKLLCGKSACRVYANGHALYWDDDHLSLEGARYVASMFDGKFG